MPPHVRRHRARRRSNTPRHAVPARAGLSLGRSQRLMKAKCVALIEFCKRLIGLVNSALAQQDGGSYIEKIVQYSVQLPPINVDDIAKLLERDFRDVFDSLSENELSRFRFAWNYCIRYYILTPRDLKRLINHYYFARSAL